MADGNEIQAHAPDGSVHHFPTGTDPAVIDQTMKQYIAGGGNESATPQPESGLTKVGRGAALGAFSGAGIPETTTPIQSLIQGGVDQAKNPNLLDPTGGALTSAVNLIKGLFGSYSDVVRGAGGSTGDVMAGIVPGAAVLPMGGGQADPEQFGHGIGSLASQALLLKGGKEAAETPIAESELGGALKSGGHFGKAVGDEVMGIGGTSERMKADAIAHANAVKQHVSEVEQMVESRAKQAVQAPIRALDDAHPDGYYNKGDIASGVKDEIKDIVTTPDAISQMPQSVKTLLQEEKAAPTARELTNNEKQMAMVAQREVLDKGGSLDDAKSMLKNAGYTPKQVDAMLSTMGGETGKATSGYTGEQLRQFRSAVGRDLGRYENKGAAGAALNSVYRYLTGQLREGTRSVGTESDFLNGDAQYKAWKDDFHRSPIKKILNGETTADILKGLTAEQSASIFDKYKDTGMNTEGLSQEAKRSSASKTIGNMSRPTKWDLIVGAIRPEIGAMRVGVPYLARHPSFLNWIAGKGLDTTGMDTGSIQPKIKAKQVALRNQP